MPYQAHRTMKNTSHTLIWDLLGKTVIVSLVAIAVLQQSVTERIERETAIFDLARDNLDVFTKEFLRLYFEGDEGAHRMEREFSDGVSSRTRTDFWRSSVRRSRRVLPMTTYPIPKTRSRSSGPSPGRGSAVGRAAFLRKNRGPGNRQIIRGLLALMREVSAGGGTFSLMASRPHFVVTIGSAAMAART